MNRGEEDYLKALYEIQTATDDLVSNASLAFSLNHSAQSVNEMIKKLALKGYVDYTPYQGSRLSKSGLKEAVSLLRKHRLWELFLYEKLGYSWEELHEEAEVLEHVSSPKLTESLFLFLGKPSYCPHGNPIPANDGELHKRDLIPLAEATAGGHYTLRQVVDHQELLVYLLKIGLELNQTLQVLYHDSLNDFVTISLQEKSIPLGYRVARNLFVEETRSIQGKPEDECSQSGNAGSHAKEAATHTD